MGVFTDNMQALNRGFISERAEKRAEQEKRKKLLQKQNDYKNFLYKKFYAQFYASQKNNKNSNPDNILGKFQDFEQMQKIINNDNFTELEIFFRIENYNKILNKTYKQFKTDFKLNIDTSKQEHEEAKELQRLLKIYNNNQKIIARQEAQLRKIKQQQRQQLIRCKKEISKGFAKIGLGLFVGGRLASKTYKKMK